MTEHPFIALIGRNAELTERDIELQAIARAEAGHG